MNEQNYSGVKHMVSNILKRIIISMIKRGLWPGRKCSQNATMISTLECGCNIGRNVRQIKKLIQSINSVIEINSQALEICKSNNHLENLSAFYIRLQF